ncbi:hypothetical protein THOM_1374 [Trachipleistophora hominis]|uniref:Uncharacterized protein n=1 Tax=Trachipleistophora hominis TaxID=72359 RepID=L7JYA1_TRAHO|nr:hypothetical protein THOM_1374 [Trachipleistophora hominis]
MVGPVDQMSKMNEKLTMVGPVDQMSKMNEKLTMVTSNRPEKCVKVNSGDK